MGEPIQNKDTNGSSKAIYNKYSYELRRKLIDLVEQGRTLASAAKELHICQTTARLIISTWKEEGRIFEKKADKEKRAKKEAKKKKTQKSKLAQANRRRPFKEDSSHSDRQ
jgi:transposase